MGTKAVNSDATRSEEIVCLSPTSPTLLIRKFDDLSTAVNTKAFANRTGIIMRRQQVLTKST